MSRSKPLTNVKDDRKQELDIRATAEIALRDSEHRLRQLIEGLPQLVWTCTPQGNCDYLSPQWVAYTGIPETPQLNSGWINQVFPADRDAVLAAWSHSVATGEPFHVEYRIRGANGQFCWFDARAIPLRNVQGDVVKWFGSCTDIHESRQATADLERERKKLANLVAFAPAVLYSFCLRPDGSSSMPYNSPNVIDICGLTPEETLHDASPIFRIIHPDDRESVNASIRDSAKTMTPWHAEFRILHRLKGERWMEGHSTPTLDDDRSIVWHGFVSDITDRKRFEDDQNFLLQLGSQLQTASGPDAIAELATKTLADHLGVRKCSLSAINGSRQEATVLGEYMDKTSSHPRFTYPLTKWGSEQLLTHLASGNALVVEDARSHPLVAPHYSASFQPLGVASLLAVPQRREGQWVALLTLSHPEPRPWAEREIDLVRSASERIWPAYETARALAAERATNESLASSEERLRLALQSGSLGIWEQNHLTGDKHCDSNGRSILGFPEGLPFDPEAVFSRVHPGDLDAVRHAAQALLNPNGSGHFEVSYRLEVGSHLGPRYIYSQGQTFFSGEGANRRPVRSVGTVQDITERKVFEAKLQRSLDEKQILLQEVHHRVKNNLQIISSLLSMQSNLIEDQLAVAKLVDSERRVRSMAMIHEHLYRQRDMSSIDLFQYARDLVAELFYSISGNPSLTFRFEGSPVTIALDQAIPCGLMLNELITNAVKYAYPDGKGEILIKLITEGDFVSVSVSDSGVGLPPGFNPDTSQSLGMTIIHVLTQQLDGNLEIVGSPGTSFTARFPNRRRVTNPEDKPSTPPKKLHATP